MKRGLWINNQFGYSVNPFDITERLSGILDSLGIINTVYRELYDTEGLVVRYFYDGCTIFRKIPYERLRNGLYLYDIACIVHACEKGLDEVAL